MENIKQELGDNYIHYQRGFNLYLLNMIEEFSQPLITNIDASSMSLLMLVIKFISTFAPDSPLKLQLTRNLKEGREVIETLLQDDEQFKKLLRSIVEQLSEETIQQRSLNYFQKKLQYAIQQKDTQNHKRERFQPFEVETFL